MCQCVRARKGHHGLLSETENGCSHTSNSASHSLEPWPINSKKLTPQQANARVHAKATMT